MPLAEVYAEIKHDFRNKVQSKLNDAKTALSKYSHPFDNTLLTDVIKFIFKY